MSAAMGRATLVAQAHDADGRLVGLTYDSSPARQAPEANPWLVAVDRSENALRAVNFAVGQAGEARTCAFHLVHVQPWLAKEAAESELAGRVLDATAPARAVLEAANLPWRLHVVMGDAAECILATAARLNASGIVIGSRGLNAVEGLLFGSVAYKVAHLSRVPVVVVP